jgi:hypothetical protein
MPRRTERQKNAHHLMVSFLRFCKLRDWHLTRRARRQRQQNRRNAELPQEDAAPDLIFDHHDIHMLLLTEEPDNLSTSSGPSSSSGTSPNEHNSSQTPNSDSQSVTSSLSEVFSLSSASASTFNVETSTSFNSESENDIPFLYSSNSESDSDSAGTESSDPAQNSTDSTLSLESTLSDVVEDLSGFEGDIEDWSDSDSAISGHGRATIRNLGRFVRKGIAKMYASRYEKSRKRIPRGSATPMRDLLNKYKHDRPDYFREDLRVFPTTFDHIVTELSKHPIFQNNSPNSQMPIEDQVAITLYRFGHFGNAAGINKVARWSGYAKGTIFLATRRVLTAILSKEFMDIAVALPTNEEKEEAKQWVADHSCEGWRDGWCMVDGTLVPLFDKPFWYGESYFDRKCNYSLNIQVCHML